MSESAEVFECLDYLESAWPSLVAIGIEPSNASRSTRSRRLLPSEVAARNARDLAAEAEERGRPGWKHIPVRTYRRLPLDVDMLDLLAEVVSVAEDVAETVTQTAGTDRPHYAESGLEDPRGRLRKARAWLTAAQEADERTIPWALGRLLPVRRRVAMALGEIVDGQVLDALCPWCGGRTVKRPVGGDRTLVVQAPEAGLRVVCLGVNCEPDESSCGMRVHGQPAWPEREWDWLAKRLEAVR